MKAQLIFLEVLISFLPALSVLLWGVILWFSSIDDIIKMNFNSYSLAVFFSIPLGVAGFIGVATLALNLATEEEASKMSTSQKICITSGIVSAIIAGTLFLSEWSTSWIVIMPILVTIHLNVLHVRKLNLTRKCRRCVTRDA